MRSRKSKKPVNFAFMTDLSPEQVLPTISQELIEFNAEHELDLRYYVPQGSKNRFRIGLERDGHSNGGYWYCAQMQKTDGFTHISGKIVYNPDENDVEQPKEKPSFIDQIMDAALFVLVIIPALLLVAGMRIYYLIKKKRWDYKKEDILVDFMTKYMDCEIVQP